MPPGNQTSGRTELGSGYCLPMGLSQGSPRKPACQPFPSSSLTQPPLLSVPVPPTPRTHLAGLAVLVSDLPLLSALIPLTLPFAIPTQSQFCSLSSTHQNSFLSLFCLALYLHLPLLMEAVFFFLHYCASLPFLALLLTLLSFWSLPLPGLGTGS